MEGKAKRSIPPRAMRLIIAALLVAGLVPLAAMQAPPPALAGPPGTVTGEASIVCLNPGPTNNDYNLFGVTMPDGQYIVGHCLDYGQAAPADGTYSFTGVWDPAKQAYKITLDTEGATKNPGSQAPYPCQRVGEFWWAPVGWLDLQKASANPAITDGNGCYSLEGAEYGVFASAADAEAHRAPLDYLVTDASGWDESIALVAGTYYVHETAQPEGYLPDETVYETEVSYGQTARVNAEAGGTVYDTPGNDPVGVLVGKKDADTGQMVPQGGASLAGAQFTVEYYDAYHATADAARASGKATCEWVFASNERGQVRLSSSNFVSGDPLYTDPDTGLPTMPYGTYVYHETKEPPGYLLPDSPSVFVTRIVYDASLPNGEAPNFKPFTRVEGDLFPTEGNEPDSKTLQAEKVAAGDVALTKIGERVPTSGGSGMKDPLAGVSFDIINANSGPVKRPDGTLAQTGEVVVTITTDDRGYAETTGGTLPYGTYTMHERPETVPPGYETVDDFDFTVTTDKQQLYYVLEDGTGTAIRIVKTDAETGKQVSGHMTFRILDANMEVVTFTRHYPTVTQMTAFTTAADGSCVLPEKLNGGSQYYVQEIAAPDGYILSPDPVPFIADGGGGWTWDNPLTVTLSNAAQKGIVRVTKADAETGKTVPVEGIVFDITAAADIVTNDGTVRALAGETVDTVTTGADGTAASKALYLGTYHITETQAPPGYILNPDPVTITIEYGDQTLEIVYGDAVVADDPQMGIVRVTKTDAETGKTVPVEGIVFDISAATDIVTNDGTVRALAGETVDTVTTGADGTASSKALYLGTYNVTETKAPAGYVLNPEPVTVTLAYGGQDVEVVYGDAAVANVPQMGIIELAKADTETGEAVAGAVYAVTAAADITAPDGTVRALAGEVVDTVTTGADGTARSKALYLGAYTVTETQAPPGYVLDPTVHEAVLAYGGQDVEIVTVHLDATDRPTEITLKKSETGTGAPLEGIVFDWWDFEAETHVPHAKGAGRVGATIEDSSYITVTGAELVAADDPDGPAISAMELGADGIWLSANVPYGTYALRIFYAYSDGAAHEGIVPVPALSAEAPVARMSLTPHTGADGDVLVTSWQAEALPAFVAQEDITQAATAADGTIQVKYLAPGTYGFAESATLPGYILDTAPQYVTVGADGRIDGQDSAVLEFINDYTKLEISKTDALTGSLLPGNALALYKAPQPGSDEPYGDLVEAWVTDGTPRAFTHLPPGDYILHEVTPAPGYLLADDVPFTVTATAEVQAVVMTNDYTRIDITKTDAETGLALAGAWLALKDADGAWVDPRGLASLPGGEEPAFAEVAFAEDGQPAGTAPAGTSDTVNWTLKDADGKVLAGWEGTLPPADEVFAAMLEHGNGCTLDRSTSPSDSAAYAWQSTDTAVRFDGLEPGAYTLVEIAAPQGYLVAGDVPFTVADTADIQAVTMADAPVPPPPPMPKTGDPVLPMALLAALAAAGAAVLVIGTRRRDRKEDAEDTQAQDKER